MNLRIEYDRYKIDETRANCKWGPVIRQSKYLSFHNEEIIRHISIFLEKYEYIYSSSIYSYMMPPTMSPSSLTPISNMQFTTTESLRLIVDDVNKYIIEDQKTKLNIVSEYYNLITGKKGILLENNVRLEDGKLINPKHQEKIDNTLKKIIDKRITFILEPDKISFYQREDKIKRILKD